MAPRMDVSDISEVYTGGAIAKPPPPIGKKGKILIIGTRSNTGCFYSRTSPSFLRLIFLLPMPLKILPT